jgi:hypothetical protein
MLNKGRLSVGAATLAVRQAIRPKPTAAATRPIVARLLDASHDAVADGLFDYAGHRAVNDLRLRNV